jgi:CHAD domain-containing protein
MIEKGMKEYAKEQVAARLTRVAFQLQHAVKLPDDDAIHDLRVSIRRYSAALKIFGGLLGEKAAAKIRKRLKRVMGLAGEVRNRDIALAMAAKAGVADSSRLVKKLGQERRECMAALKKELMRLERKDFSQRWRAWLS